MQVETMTKCNFMNACHVDVDVQVLTLIKSNIIQSSIFVKFSNNNSIKIEIISTEKIIFYNKSQITK